MDNYQCDILIVGLTDYPNGKATSNHISRICRGLQLQGWTPAILGVTESEGEQQLGEGAQIPHANICVSITPRTPFFIPKLMLKIGNILSIRLEDILKKGTVRSVIFHGSSYSAFDSLFEICRNYNVAAIPYLVEYPTLTWLTIFTGAYFEERKYLGKTLLKSSGIIGISSFWEDFAKKRSIPSTIIPSYLSYEKGDIPVHNHESSSTEEFHIVTIGLWVPRELPSMLLRAVKMVYEKGISIKYTAIGNIGHHPLEHNIIKKYKKDPVLQKIVTLTGWVDVQTKDKILKSADAFVFLRKQNKETAGLFPTRLPEYLMYARPVILSKAGDPPKYLEHKKSAWIIPQGKCPEELRDAIIELYYNKNLADSIGQAGFLQAKESFSIESNGKRMSNFISDVML